MENATPKVSVIVCSIHPGQAQAVRENVARTIGVEHEVIIFDNRDVGRGICCVYNECAAQSRGEYLCFVHEDVAFCTDNWGPVIIGKLQERSCGVIGFAGSAVKYAFQYGWQGVRRFTRKNYVAGYLSNGGSLRKSDDKCDFAPVICLDGMCLIVRKDVWAECRFDEETFPGFHSYDTDFTTATTVAGYSNYVCHSILVEHHSQGSFSKAWAESVAKYNEKWCNMLPLYVREEVGKQEVERYAVAAEVLAVRRLLKNRIPDEAEMRKEIYSLWKRHPFNIGVFALVIRFVLTRYEGR